jgi:hypothetical protein
MNDCCASLEVYRDPLTFIYSSMGAKVSWVNLVTILETITAFEAIGILGAFLLLSPMGLSLGYSISFLGRSISDGALSPVCGRPHELRIESEESHSVISF